jgi:iron complex transport system permease protein
MSSTASTSMKSDALPARAVTSGRLGRSVRGVGLLAGLLAVLVMALISIRFGAHPVSTRSVWDALFHYDPTVYDQAVVRSQRVPRTVIAIGVGAGLAVAGATMQAVTRNPLASPSILGVSSGSAFAVVTAVFFLGLTRVQEYLWFSFLGAIAASAIVFAIGSIGGATNAPVRLTLAGVAISAMLGSWTSALLLLSEETFDQIRFWFAGSVVGRDLDTFLFVLPFLAGGSLICVLMGHQLNVLSMSEDAARALGMNTTRVRLICAGLVVLITGAAVSVTGPIGFVGLAVPHIVRSIVGPDYRWVLPYSVLGGAIFLVGADIIGRLILPSGEIQAGIITGIAGAPFLIYLARKRSLAS